MAFVDLTCKHSFPFQLGRAGAPLSRERKELHSALATALPFLESFRSPRTAPGREKWSRARGWKERIILAFLSCFFPPSASQFCASERVSHGAKSLESTVYCFRSLLRLVCIEQCKSEEAVCERMGGGDTRGTRGSLGYSPGAGL